TGVGEQRTESAPHDPERHTLKQKFPGNLGPTCAHGRAYSEFPLPPFRPHEKKVRHVGARNEEHHPNGSQQYPEHLAYVAHGIPLQGTNVWAKPGLLKHLASKSRRKRELLHSERDHASHVGVRLFQSNTGFEPRDSLVAEIPHERLAALQLERKE